MMPAACPAARQPVKLRGRTVATDELRARCLARVREGRERLFGRLRELADEHGSCADGLRSVARELLQAEVQRAALPAWLPCGSEALAWGGGGGCPAWQEPEGVFDEEALLDLEQELLRELELEAEQRDLDEAEAMLRLQNEEDCALFEQHLLGGVPCPLCGLGRLEQRRGELRCTACGEMHAAMMDESLHMEDVGEMLGLAEEQHCRAGCSSRRAHFEVSSDFGASVLYLRCNDCGWREVVL
uniref:RPA-interacting protein C-terminal domain-containing protein n=1 Tax=Pyrodinium bahamense TaxID=73915 RepID=A0A7S0FF67_9DINO|mmetsp:Transcript_25740/g.70812  ORF Transcript_25740/g.70812 Transcript_25740/m.70812 type:complete len:243 (+) Transcript_25740:53-781(+)